VPGIGKEKPGGATPTTEQGRPSTKIDRPIAAGLEPKRLLHRAWLSTTTQGAPWVASSARKKRPAAGATPSSGNRTGETDAPGRRSGSSRPTVRTSSL
jgi:hypothetical protein